MADITANVDAWSSTEASNSPAGSTTIGTGLDDNLRAIEAGVVVHVERLNRTANLALACTVSSNALTIALKGKDGNDPSSTNKVRVPFRNVTVATGDYSQVVVSAATSVVVSSGSTLGTTDNTAFRFWVVGFNDAGTFRLGVINCRSGVGIYRLPAWGIASSTAEGGAGAADSAQVIYTGTAVTSKAFVILGYLTYESGLGTAGTYASVPTRVQLFDFNTALPGAVVQRERTNDSAVATGSTQLPFDNSTPQSGEGDQFLSRAITPSSAANLLRVKTLVNLANDTAVPVISAALFQDATAGALAATSGGGVANLSYALLIDHALLAGTTSATTFKVRGGGNAAGTTTFNGSAGAIIFNVMNSFIEVEELMA